MPKLPVRDVIEAARTGTRSPLYEYLWTEFDTLLPELTSGQASVNWKAVAEKFRAAGIQAGRGKDVTEQIVRQTWWRVKADKKTKVRLKDQWTG
jgi:hypothetical protein